MPGLRLNIGKRGVSVSAGRRGATVNLSRRGVRTTVGIPGTGISYSTLHKAAPGTAEVVPHAAVVSPPGGSAPSSSGVGLGIVLVLAGVVAAAVAFGAGGDSSSSTASTPSAPVYSPSAATITTSDAGVDFAAPPGAATLPAAYEPSRSKACSHGCPCGNACISCDKVCHGGSTAAHHRHHR